MEVKAASWPRVDAYSERAARLVDPTSGAKTFVLAYQKHGQLAVLQISLRIRSLLQL